MTEPARPGAAGSPARRRPPGHRGRASGDGPVRGRWRPPGSGIIRGCWQLSSGHGAGWTRERAFAALDAAAAQPGRLVLDCADIYTGVERLVGAWMAQRGAGAADVAVHTKFVPDLDMLPRMSRAYVRRIVNRSRERLGVNALDMVQFHWWDLAAKGWVRAAEWLAELQEEGAVRRIGVTNFGSGALAALLDAGIPVVANQVQLSLLDRRPLARLAPMCRERGVALLCYGTLAGGLLAGAEVRDASAGRVAAVGGGNVGDEPFPPRRRAPAARREDRSVAKYRLVAREVGGAEALGRAQEALRAVAARNRVRPADVAVAYALAQPAVGAAIVGLSRRGLGPRPRAVQLGAADLALLEAAVPATVPGAVYEAERDRKGPHGRIMRYNLNRKGGRAGRLSAVPPSAGPTPDPARAAPSDRGRRA